MDENLKREELLLKIMHLLSNKFKNDCALKGGMLLRLYNSPRYTQDIDFVMRTKVSRKIIIREIEALLKNAIDISFEKTSLNSRGIFIDVKSENILVQIEISIVKEFEMIPETLTTASLAIPLKMTPQIITVMPRPVAFSNKIAASLERKNSRDLYDLSLYEPMTEFDQKTLQKRLDNLFVNRQKPIKISFFEAAKRLKERIKNLEEKDFENELAGFLPVHFLKNIDKIVKASVFRVCQRLEML